LQSFIVNGGRNLYTVQAFDGILNLFSSSEHKYLKDPWFGQASIQNGPRIPSNPTVFLVPLLFSINLSVGRAWSVGTYEAELKKCIRYNDVHGDTKRL
jgi:hypothetical protein